MFLRDRPPVDAKSDRRSELARWGFLAAVAVWIFHPFATSRFYGTGDALWYSNMLADFVLQWRAGVFPVWVGQTEYVFNGAVYPLRVAPMYQHVGGVLDLITFHRLTFFELQHAIVIVMGVSGIISCYTCLISIAPRHRWAAALLTTLYITCPGVLGLIFIQDLYMSWMTVPFLPIAFYGVVRSYEKDDFAAWLAIAIGLGGCWLGHAPIAMWVTAIAGMSQLIRLLFVHRGLPSWKRALLGTALLVALAQYPFVSVATLHAPGAAGPAGSSLEHPERIVEALRTAFPGSLRPLSTGAGELSDLQLGYGLIAAMFVAGLGLARTRNWTTALLLGAAIGILFILVPIPRWTNFFWLRLAPEQVRVLTFYWPMHRLYIVLAITITFACAAGLAKLGLATRTSEGRGVNAISRKHVERMGIAAISRSIGAQDGHRPRYRTQITSRESSPDDPRLRAFREIAALFFPRRGGSGTGISVTGPANGYSSLRPAPSEERLSSGAMKVSQGADPGVWELSPSFTLVPGQRYELKFAFTNPNLSGVLQITGASFFREHMSPGKRRTAGFRLEGQQSRFAFCLDDEGNTRSRFTPFYSERRPGERHLRLCTLRVSAKNGRKG